jgi:hypothetical protein
MARISKNPFMSMWLSAANRVANTGRGAFTAAAKRQQTAMANEATKSVLGFWSKAMQAPAGRKRSRSK